MFVWRKKISRYRSTCWILIAAVFALTVFPVHLHYHYQSDSHPVVRDTHHDPAPAHIAEDHGHQADLHALSGASFDEDHSTVHVFKASPDVLARKLNNDPGSVLLFILILFLVPVFSRQTPTGPMATVPFVFKTTKQLTPPLRAPPKT